MEISEIRELITRISREPSVLFWGQNYLGSRDGTNLFYDLVNHNMCAKQLSSTVDYSEMWSCLNKGKGISASTFEEMKTNLSLIPEQKWLRKIMSMRWGMIMTSAFDSVMTTCVGDDLILNPISLEDRRVFNRSYVSKKTLNMSFLYGSLVADSIDTLPPADCSKRGLASRKKKIGDRINWIYNDILSDYGVLVIDGWNPEHDWLKDLLANAGEMPYASIYLFGANEEILENEDVTLLIESNILVPVEQRFAEVLSAAGFFEETEERYESSNDSEGRLLTINGAAFTIPSDELVRLDSHITVLYDEIWMAKSKDEGNNLYADFQAQSDRPIWHLYNRDKYPFYFQRSIDEKLIKTVRKELHQTSSYDRKYIILEGNSNTGKTASLVNLAFKLRNDSPVIYIYDEPGRTDWIEHLKKFIKNTFVDKQSGGKWIDSVLVIWDANTDYNAVQRCKQLQDSLRECNVTVVGSAYSLHWKNEMSSYRRDGAGNHHFRITADLDQVEYKEMLSSIEKVNTSIYEELVSLGDTGDNHLLHILQNIAHLEYDEEWRAVASVIESRFNQEVDANETFSDDQLTYYKNYLANKVEKEIASFGVASAWQIKLASIREQLEQDDNLSSERQVQLDRYGHMEMHIQQLNSILAIAGEFSVDLPLSLILRMISGKNQDLLNDEQLFLIKIIENDSLLRYSRDDEGYVKVNFRHPSEAELYIKYNKSFGDSDQERKAHEVDLLMKMISECKWQDEHESIPVTALIRGFGPNSHGTINRPRKANVRHYSEYKEWWMDIANSLHDMANGYPEVDLVYALFVRSHCRDEIEKIEKSTSLDSEQKKDDLIAEQIKVLNDTKHILEEAINSHNQSNKFQYCRLLGEMCANIVYGMGKAASQECVTRFNQLCDYFSRAVKNWTDNVSQNLFTKNALLDIWLNGVENYFHARIGYANPMGDAECAKAVADSIHYISTLFDLSDEEFDNEKMLDKINMMYGYVDENHIKEFEAKLETTNNDTYLYLRACKCWLNRVPAKDMADDADLFMKEIYKNLFLMPDDLDRVEQDKYNRGLLKKNATEAAQEVIQILEQKLSLIKRAKSSRCMYMLIKAKWLIYTGNLPLEIKQHIRLSFEQWKEIGELCANYILYSDSKNEQIKPAPVLLRMVYIWNFTRDMNEFVKLKNRQALLRSSDEWYFERICICNSENAEPRKFFISLELKHGSKDKYIAKIIGSEHERVTKQKDLLDKNVIGKTVHVPDSVVRLVLGDNIGSQLNNYSQPIIIWFNAKGPQISTIVKGGTK